MSLIHIVIRECNAWLGKATVDEGSEQFNLISISASILTYILARGKIVQLMVKPNIYNNYSISQ